MLRRGLPCLLFTAALAAGCGSRSGVLGITDTDDDAGSGGSGGGSATTTPSSSTTSAGGGGNTTTSVTGTGGVGGPIDCGDLTIDGPPAGLDGGFGYHQRNPAWTLSSDDGTRVTLLSSWQPAEGPAGSDFPVSIRHTTLEPWYDFPSGELIGPNEVASQDGGATFAAARAAGGHFAVAFDDTEPPDGGLVFGGHFTPFEPGPPPEYYLHPTAEKALFMAQGPWFGQPLAAHLVGMSVYSEGIGAYSFFAGFAAEYDGFFYEEALGCASGPLFADAVGVGDHWIMALSTGSAFAQPQCFDPDPGLAWPDEVQIAIATQEGAFSQTDFLGAPGGATELKMAPRSDGAWLVFGTPPGQVVNGMYLGARVSLEGKVLSTFQVGGGDPSQEIMIGGTLAAASVNDHLVVAWIDVAGDKGPFLRVKTFDPIGNHEGGLEIFPETAFDGAPALLGSPITPSALLAWSEVAQPGLNESRIRAVRIDCLVGE